ncbi:TIGR02594 family protein [Sphingomonas montanisoli]|uniref:TIGR02594 family protein n=1 Tax=Sphingomonas montanisoli TaxID=2606412 RepID=A0A5D9BXM1_9SPHN|nr:TIGR02594 family protein [Sphingomonas montanisoli]TZG24116.1 TIGR02594 family protein [Sphingomonas montanisoli]
MFDRKALFDKIREVKGHPLTQADVDAVNAVLDGLQPGTDPRWLIEARKDLGLKEIPGAQHAPRIINMLKLLRYPFSDDETPWCGTAMAAWMTQAGIAPPPQAYRAANWRDWGMPCTPQVGAVGVKSRVGGNHVTMIVGITADRKFYKGLGANQSNGVNIADFPVDVIDSFRWPSTVAVAGLSLPVMPRGTLVGSEA